VKIASQVLVVGAGPVGLALAAELEIAGVHAVVVEQLAEPDTLQKARGVGVLAAEALRRRGLGTQLQTLHHSGRGDYRRDMGSNHAHFAWIHKLDATIDGEQNRVPALIWQPELERLLADQATGLGAELLRAHTVTALSHDDTHVRVVLQTPGGLHEITASYLVGCDGGRSSVRKLADFDFPGIDSTVLGRVGRLKLAHRASFPAPTNNEHGSLQHGGPDDGWVRVRLNERDDNTPGAHGGDHERSPVSVQEMRDAIQRVTGAEVAITEIQEGRRFRDNSRQASTYRKGRVLLAGDAAHVHSPLGGQGLNLGIMDAVNLGWKLAAVLGGFGHDELLDTYTRERHPVGAAVLNNTRAQAALLTPSPQVVALREIMSDLMDIPDVKEYLGRMLSGVGVRYPLPYAGTDHELLGGHVPDFVVDDTTLYAIMSDGRPVLLHTPQAGAIREAAESWQDRVHIVSALVLGRPDLSAALIRPDGVLAWAATPSTSPDTTCLKTALHTWFGPRVTPGVGIVHDRQLGLGDGGNGNDGGGCSR
jgi:2-polyprenyl-6-methoxyphenol hydroxylase-like FAD-dependent oxidoreductase